MAALFFDVDGTLIDSFHDNRVISPAVRSELARVQSLGHKIFLSSGRSRKLLTPNLLEPGFDGLVLVNGGVVEMGDVPIYEERMGYDLARATVDFLVDRDDRERITAEAAEVLGPAITCDGHGGEGTFELYPTAISKAKGIEVALGQLGLGPKDAYAFGDGTNDLEMLEYCGCGVAMDNAQDEVKAVADLVCPPVWEDGLAQALLQLF